jgi:hypothetical protein
MRPELAGFVGRGAVSWAQVYICRVNASTGINRLPFVVSPVDMSHREGDRGLAGLGEHVVAHAEPLIQLGTAHGVPVVLTPCYTAQGRLC